MDSQQTILISWKYFYWKHLSWLDINLMIHGPHLTSHTEWCIGYNVSMMEKFNEQLRTFSARILWASLWIKYFLCCSGRLGTTVSTWLICQECSNNKMQRCRFLDSLQGRGIFWSNFTNGLIWRRAEMGQKMDGENI